MAQYAVVVDETIAWTSWSTSTTDKDLYSHVAFCTTKYLFKDVGGVVGWLVALLVAEGCFLLEWNGGKSKVHIQATEASKLRPRSKLK